MLRIDWDGQVKPLGELDAANTIRKVPSCDASILDFRAKKRKTRASCGSLLEHVLARKPRRSIAGCKSERVFGTRWGPSSFGKSKDQRTCSSKVNFAAKSLALSSGLSMEKIFLPAMACSSEGEFWSGVVAGVKVGVSSITGCTWIVACFKSLCLSSPSTGLACPKLIVAMVINLD